MRRALGSEQVVRENSARTLSHQNISTPTELELIDVQTPDTHEAAVSIFERDPFKEFTNKKFKELMKQENMQKIIDMREQALEMRHKTQMETLKKMLDSRKFSPKTFHNKKIELEKWIKKERDDIRKSKKEIERGWISTADSIKRTQRDIQFLHKVVGTSEDLKYSVSDLSLRQSFTDENYIDKLESGNIRIPTAASKSPVSTNIKIIDKFELRENLTESINNAEREDPESVRLDTYKDEFTQDKISGIGTQDFIQTPVRTDESPARDSSHGGDDQGLEFTLQRPGVSGSKSFDKDQLTEEKQSNVNKEHITTESSAKKPQDYIRDTLERLKAEESYKETENSPKNSLPSMFFGRSSVRTESPNPAEKRDETDNEIDAEVRPTMLDKEIEWQSEARLSPHESRSDIKSTQKIDDSNRNINRVRGHRGAMLDDIDYAGNSSLNLSPKTDQNNKYLFQEQGGVSASAGDLDQKSYEHKESRSEHEHLNTLSDKAKLKDEEAHSHLNLQQKTDLVAEEVFRVLLEELGKEFVMPGKEHLADKVRILEEAGPIAGLQNLIENNHYFTQGAEKHHNFQANIPMIPTALLPEHGEATHHKHSKIDLLEHNTLAMEAAREEERIQDEQKQNVEMMEDEMDQILDRYDENLQITEPPLIDLYRDLGIKTELKAVQDYINMIFAEAKGSYMDELLTNMNAAIGLMVPEKLSNMHAYDLAGSESSLEMSASLQQAILNIQLYLKVEERLMDENPTKNEVSVELEHIHNKMIFDCLNEILDSFRPYGLAGEPYPWKMSIRAAKPPVINKDTLDKTINKAKGKVVEWASFMCGYYGDRDDFIQDRTQSFTEDYLAQLKEERLSKMLAAEVHEMEDKWVTYDDEEAEVQLEISDLIFDKLVTETAELILKINNQRRGIRGRLLDFNKQEDKKPRRKGSL